MYGLTVSRVTSPDYECQGRIAIGHDTYRGWTYRYILIPDLATSEKSYLSEDAHLTEPFKS